MKDKLKQIQQKALSAFQDAREIKDVDDLKVKFLGKKGELTAILKEMGKLPQRKDLSSGRWRMK